MTAKELIKELDLQPHPEGGFFREMYRSTAEINVESLSSEFKGSRSVSTCIYFLLTSEAFSSFHKINQDEIWHFYLGSPIQLHTLSPEGVHTEHHIGNDIKNLQYPQFVVPKGHWFSASVLNEDSYALVGCTVAPGFDFQDFELAKCQQLTAQFPEHAAVIKKYTRG
ncbi:MAG: cupin domain-containing protein [Bacteroidota bacterium]